MNKTEVIIYGAAKTGIFVAEVIREDFPQYQVVGFVDDNLRNHQYPVQILGTSEDLEEIRSKRGLENVVLGFSVPTKEKLDRARALEERGFKFPGVYNPRIDERYGMKIGKGVLIHPSSVLFPQTEIGDFTMINGLSFLESTKIGSGVLIASNTFIGSRTQIGDATAIFPGARVFPDVTIGKNVLVGANMVVRKNLPDNARYITDKRE